jgi:hypothetical protein
MLGRESEVAEATHDNAVADGSASAHGHEQHDHHAVEQEAPSVMHEHQHGDGTTVQHPAPAQKPTVHPTLHEADAAAAEAETDAMDKDVPAVAEAGYEQSALVYDEGEQLPLRSPEGEAALERMKRLEDRRWHLYDRLDDMQEKRLQQRLHEHVDEGGLVTAKEILAPVPKGMTTEALAVRSQAAHRAAVLATKAARRAAEASMVAAANSSMAAQAAKEAADAASRCASMPPLDMQALVNCFQKNIRPTPAITSY